MAERALHPLVRPDIAPRDLRGPRVPYTPNTRDEEARAAYQRRPARDEVEIAARTIDEMTHVRHRETPVLGLGGGVISGAVVGSIAGPAGAVAGALLGGIVGAATGLIYEEQLDAKDRREDRLDKEIGVAYGHLGVASPNAPPARLGHFGAASAGMGGAGDSDHDMANGPIPMADIDGIEHG